MFSRPLRSALFIDFENVGSSAISGNVGNLLQWFSDGAFEKAGRKRRLLTKRVYWNSQAERYRDAFVEQRVDVVLCERFASLKNSADIKMAIDIVEFAMRNPRLKEVIMLTTDSDFVPVIQWLANRGVKTAIVVNEDNPTAYTAFSYHADQLIPRRHLTDALRYVRPQRTGLFGRKGAARPVEKAAPAQPIVANPPEVRPPAKKLSVEPSNAVVRNAVDLRPALAQVVRVTSAKPNLNTSQRDIERALGRVPGFSKTDSNSYFGCGSYKSLMFEMGKLEPRVKVGNAPGNGVFVRYVPAD